MMLPRSPLSRRARWDRVPRSQAGAVLVTGMIMLIMLVIMAVGVIRLSTRHTEVVNNEQLRSEATLAANYALDLLLNQPYTTWTTYAGSGATSYVNLGISSMTDTAANSVQVTVSNLACKRTRVIKNSELVTTVGGFTYVAAADASCFGSSSSPITIVTTGSAGTTSDDSLCATVLYDVQAQANDPSLVGASVPVKQGVEVRTDITTVAGGC